MNRTKQRLTRLLSLVVACAVVGVVMLWDRGGPPHGSSSAVIARDPAPRGGTEPMRSVQEAAALRGRVAAAPDAAAVAELGGTLPPSDTEEPRPDLVRIAPRTDDPAFAAHLDARVIGPDGASLTTGIVYAFAAGAPGGNELRFPHGRCSPDGRFRVPVPRAGVYDVGYAGAVAGRQVYALATNVSVAESGPSVVTLRVPPQALVRIELGESVVAPQDFRFSVSLGDGDGSMQYPGRGQGGEVGRVVRVERFPTEVEFGDEHVEWGAWVQLGSETRRLVHLHAHCDPASGRGSGCVVVHVAEMPTVLVSLRGWEPDEPEGVYVSAIDAEGNSLYGGYAEWPDVREIEIQGRPGVFRMEAKARGAVIGSAVMTLPTAGRFAQEILLSEPRAPLPVPNAELKGTRLPAFVGRPPVEVLAAVPQEGGVGVREGHLQESVVQTDWSDGVAVAVQGLDRASRPIPIRPRLLPIELLPAGTLMIVPARVPPESVGPFELERADGAPLIWPGRAYPDASRDFEGAPTVKVQAGFVLGPFPAGDVVFAVSVGGIDVGTATATVVAGEMRPLLIEVRTR